MMLTTGQQERILGMVLMGASSETACELLGVYEEDVHMTRIHDPAFRIGWFCAWSMRRSMIHIYDRQGASPVEYPDI